MRSRAGSLPIESYRLSQANPLASHPRAEIVIRADGFNSYSEAAQALGRSETEACRGSPTMRAGSPKGKVREDELGVGR